MSVAWLSVYLSDKGFYLFVPVLMLFGLIVIPLCIVKNSCYSLLKKLNQWIFVDWLDWTSYIVHISMIYDFHSSPSTNIHWKFNFLRFFSIYSISVEEILQLGWGDFKKLRLGHMCGNVHNNKVFQIFLIKLILLIIYPRLTTLLYSCC